MPIPGNLLSLVTERVDPNTSGWTAMLNATISLGSGGRNGDGCLAVKSVASGEMRARTVSALPVVAGTVYQVFADASGATVTERIGIRWLNAASAEISITWSLTTASASAAWHRIGVAGPAPAGAVRAQVVVSSSPAAAAVVSYFENVYLGLPVRTARNLLSFETESLEVSAAGWAAEANTTIARTAPMVTWPVDFYLAGGHVLALTVTANGNASAATVHHPPVNAGTDYVAYCYLNPPTSGAATWVELRWYDDTDTLISAVRGPLASPGTGWYRQLVSGVAPAGAATCAVAAGITGATAGQIVRVETAVVGLAPQMQAGTVLDYAASSFEQGTGGWTVVSGVATLARTSPWGAFALEGSYALTVSSATATTSVLRSAVFDLDEPDAGGLGFRLMYGEQVTAGGWTLTRDVRWYDAAGTDLGLTTAAGGAAPSPGWWLLYRDMVAPAGAAKAAVEISLAATATNSVIRLDRVALWRALPLMTIDVMEATASVRVTFRELPADHMITIYRVLANGARTLVRGPSGLYSKTPLASDLLIFEDYEAPLGVPFSYYAETAGQVSGVTRRETDVVTIPHDDINTAWIKDPGNPQRNARVTVVKRPVWVRPIEQAAYVVQGRRNKVIRSGRRNGQEGDLIIWTMSDEERAGFNWLLDSGNVLLWQTGPGVGVGDMYVNVGQSSESDDDQAAEDPFRTWTLPLTEADMPITVGVNGTGGRSWQDVLTEFATWEDVRKTFATWEDVLLDRRRE